MERSKNNIWAEQYQADLDNLNKMPEDQQIFRITQMLHTRQGLYMLGLNFDKISNLEGDLPSIVFERLTQDKNVMKDFITNLKVIPKKNRLEVINKAIEWKLPFLKAIKTLKVKDRQELLEQMLDKNISEAFKGDQDVLMQKYEKYLREKYPDLIE